MVEKKIGFWIQYYDHSCVKDLSNLCLNLCSLKWLKPRQSRVISLIFEGLWQLHTQLVVGLINWRILFWNVRKLSELWRLETNLFHAEIVDGEKDFLKEVCFVLRLGRLCTVLVVYGARLTGFKCKKLCSFLITLWKKKKFFVPTWKPKTL